VSSLNGCRFCATPTARSRHGCSGRSRGGGLLAAPTSAAKGGPKLAAFLRVAAAVQRGRSGSTDDTVTDAREVGATDREIHDTVLIAAMFCMYNRYVDGLATRVLEMARAYDELRPVSTRAGYIDRPSVPKAARRPGLKSLLPSAHDRGWRPSMRRRLL
jgi:hypothetical protein